MFDFLICWKFGKFVTKKGGRDFKPDWTDLTLSMLTDSLKGDIFTTDSVTGDNCKIDSVARHSGNTDLVKFSVFKGEPAFSDLLENPHEQTSTFQDYFQIYRVHFLVHKACINLNASFSYDS